MMKYVAQFVVPTRAALARRRSAVLAFVGVWVVTAFGALVAPLGEPHAAGAEDALQAPQDGVEDAAPEDLSAFLHSERWGISLKEIQETLAVGAGDTSDPGAGDPQELGYLGFVAREDSATVLLQLPDGSVDHMEVGDTLADGRKVEELGDTRLRLTGESQEEELLLFRDLEAEGLLVYPDVEDIMQEESRQQLPE